MIDASNEMQHDANGLLKFFITSRPYFDIGERFDQCIIRLAGEDESETINAEIDSMIRNRVPQLAFQKRLHHSTQIMFQESLLETENRIYL